MTPPETPSAPPPRGAASGPAKPVPRLPRELKFPWRVAANDLLRDQLYRRLWLSILTSGFGAQITLLAIPLTAAVLLHASPTQMGLLTSMELAPFVMFSLPTGVWLDRVRKLPVYVAGELTVAVVLTTVPAVYLLEMLSITYLYFVSFVIGCVFTTAGSASQIVLTQIVPRERLVEAHAKNALANSLAEVTGPGIAGALIRLVGAPLALLVDAVLLLGSVMILRGLKIEEKPGEDVPESFWHALKEGLHFVAGVRLLVVMASLVGLWQLCNQSAMVVQILFATRELGLDEKSIGLCYVGLGVGTIASYGRPGDAIRFYEIDPNVIAFAQDSRYFSFLSDSPAKVDIVVGDARLSMERELAQNEPQGFDILVIDAFSGDSIPTHLLTEEAVQLYLAHLKPGGILAFHITNSHIALEPVLALAGEHFGLHGVLIADNNPKEQLGAPSQWILFSEDASLFKAPAFAAIGRDLHTKPGIRLWTDDYSNLFQVLLW